MTGSRNKARLQADIGQLFHQPLRASADLRGISIIGRNAGKPQKGVKIFQITRTHDWISKVAKDKCRMTNAVAAAVEQLNSWKVNGKQAVLRRRPTVQRIGNLPLHLFTVLNLQPFNFSPLQPVHPFHPFPVERFQGACHKILWLGLPAPPQIV
jgi:hypothetical protein